MYLITQLKPISKLIDCLQMCFHIAGRSAKNTELADMFEYNSLEIKEPENIVLTLKGKWVGKLYHPLFDGIGYA